MKRMRRQTAVKLTSFSESLSTFKLTTSQSNCIKNYKQLFVKRVRKDAAHKQHIIESKVSQAETTTFKGLR